MSKSEPGSITLVQQVYDHPDESKYWTDLVSHYYRPMHAWARRWFGKTADADLVYSEALVRLYRMLVGPERKPPQNGSYQPYIRTIVKNICIDLFRKRRRDASAAFDEDAEALAWEREVVEDLSESLIDEEEWTLEKQRIGEVLAEYRALFREALLAKKSERNHKPRSIEIFFKKYFHGVPTSQLDAEYGFNKREGSGRHARRVRDDLVELMGLPVGSAREKRRSTTIVEELARNHGDVSA